METINKKMIEDLETTGSSPSPCPICIKIAHYIRTAEALDASEELDEVIGPLSSIRQSTACHTCQRLYTALERLRVLYDKQFGPGKGPVFRDEPPSVQQSTRETSPEVRPVKDEEVTIYSKRSSDCFFMKFTGSMPLLDMVPFDGSPADWEEDRPTIDATRIRRCIHECDTQHAGTCHTIQNPSLRLEPVPEIMVIDVEQQCLSVQSGSCRYAALSYVWGKYANMQTTVNNVAQLRCLGAFGILKDQGLLPATVYDAMLNTRRLGLRYLWVDRFCIIQDDPVHKHKQIRQMAAIYANSYFTIAACESEHSDFGIPGTAPHRPRNDPFHRFEFDAGCRVTALPSSTIFGPKGLDATYFKRGWTYQEWILPSRILIFHHQTVFWQCKQTFESENTFSVSSSVSNQFNHLDVLGTLWPDIHTYAKAIESYSKRALTYEADALVAFSAIMAALGRNMQGEILHGIPELFFDGALLWEPLDRTSQESLTRRKDQAGHTIRQLPSWSFAGWSGCDILTKFCRWVYDYKLGTDGVCTKNKPASWGDESVHLTPMVDFYKVDEMTGIRRKILNKFRISSADTEEGAYVHFSQLNNHQEFAFRRSSSPASSLPTAVWSPVIEFRTRRLWATVAQPERYGYVGRRYGNSHRVHVQVKDHANNAVGFFAAPIHNLPLGGADHDIEPCQGEFIRLSAATSSNHEIWEGLHDAEEQHASCEKTSLGYCNKWKCKLKNSGWKYAFYFVLWIEWEEGIAYRKAMGWISKEFWDSQEREEIDVRLG